MKQKMKSLVSVIVLMLMMVSMFSVCAFPASAASGDDYDNLQSGALVVNAAWADKKEGDTVSYTYRGKEITESFEAGWHFATFADAWDYAVSTGRTNPTVMICGTYPAEIRIYGAVTIIGANAGIDPVVESAAKNMPWTVSGSFADDSVITGNVVVENAAGSADISFDGVTFASGSAYMDNYRTAGASNLTFKNVVFNGAGNSASASYAVQLSSEGHARNVSLENVYITNQSAQGFVSPYFQKFVAKHIAYVNNGQGILNSTGFTAGVSPYIEFTDSCFYNSSMPSGPAISVDNRCAGFNYAISGAASEKNISGSGERPTSVLAVSNCIFYNASSSAGLIHYEFINKNSTLSLVDNYVYSSEPSSVLNPEFLIDSANIDQTGCMYIRNNALVGAFKIPDVSAGHADTRIDMSFNHFANSEGEIVERPVYVNAAKPRLIRTAFWIDEELTVSSVDPMWNLSVKDWDMYQVDNFAFEVVMTAFEETGVTDFLPKFVADGGSTVRLYKSADDVNGRYVNLSQPISQLTINDLNDDLYAPTVVYAQITNPACDYFAPVYKVTLDSVGSINDVEYFSEAWEGYYMYQPTVFDNAATSMVPYRWQGEIYKMEIGKTLFGDLESLLAYAKTKGDEIPNVVVPAGVYTSDLIIPGSCNILGEKFGVDPNVVVADVITQDNADTSGWTLNPDRSVEKLETTFKNACIRVSPDANDYVITVDGVVMGEGCSYVDDEARIGGVTNVTIFRNVIADGAGGGNDRSGNANVYLFNFNKPYSNAADFDYAYVYMYDCRIVRNQKCHVFGPFIEKLIVDHSYFGDSQLDSTGNKNFLQNFRSRAAHSPYFGITNNCWYNNEKSNTNSNGLTGTYILNCVDHSSDLSLKKNIIYNLDNNYCWNGFGASNGGFQIYHCGSNMKFIMTNNIMISSNIKGNDTFLAGNAITRWAGDSASYDCSDCLVVKGNHIIGRTQLPHTAGTGNGTLIDYSGNYYATTLKGSAMKPEDLSRATGQNYTIFPSEAYYVRYTVPYTYLDWDMTKRSDDTTYGAVGYAFNKGMYGTGTYAMGEFDGESMMIYKDTVPADCDKYELPATIGAGCEKKIEKQGSNGRFTSATNITPSAGESIFRVTVTSKLDSSKKEIFIIKLTRKINDKAQLLSMGGENDGECAYVDKAAKVVYFHTPEAAFQYFPNLVQVSNGATYKLYTDESCRTELAADIGLTYGTVKNCYMKVTAENGVNYEIYTLNLIRYSNDYPITLPVINGIDGMTYVGNDTFESSISEWYPSAEFGLDLYEGATAKVYRGSALQTASRGVYTIDDVVDGETLKIVVTAADGSTTKNYTVRFVYEANDEAELYAIDGAIETKSGLYWNLKFSNAAELKALVSDGATYQAYADINMQNAFADNVVTLPAGTGTTIYVKVTAENGVDYKVYAVSVASQANVLQRAQFSVKANGKTYPVYITDVNEYSAFLPAGVKEVSIDLSKANDTTLYAGPDRSIAFNESDKITLSQKYTKVYFITNDGQYRSVEFEGENLLVRNPQVKGSINIVSARSAVRYADANKIAGWAANAVNALNDGGYAIIYGDGANNFNGSKAVSRYEMAAFAVRALGLDVNRYANYQLSYADKIDAWALPYVRAATAAGIMSGSVKDGKTYFNGSAYATREQVATIMAGIVLAGEEMIDRTGATAGKYTDGAAYYAAFANDIDLAFNEYEFKDAKKVSSWAVPYMHLAVYFELMSGAAKADGLYLNPQATITRAEMAVMLANLLLK